MQYRHDWTAIIGELGVWMQTGWYFTKVTEVTMAHSQIIECRVAPDGSSEDEQAEAAREFLMENIGAEMEAPLRIAQHFDELERGAVEEVVSEFFGVRLRSTFEAVEIEEGRVGFRIEGPTIEVEEEE